MNIGTWEDDRPDTPESTLQSHALTFPSVSETDAESPPPLTPGLVVFDDHCHATPENLPVKGGIKGGRRTLRRPNPVAVPNLTKKARGRPVPTKDTLLKAGSGRAYACPVEDCRKVFTRAEHLKRHTRSIHTNEKREQISRQSAVVVDANTSIICLDCCSFQVRSRQLWTLVHPSRQSSSAPQESPPPRRLPHRVWSVGACVRSPALFAF